VKRTGVLIVFFLNLLTSQLHTFCHLSPSLKEIVFDASGIKDLSHDKIYYVIQVFWFLIKGRDRRRNLYAQPGELEHVFEMDRIEGHLAGEIISSRPSFNTTSAALAIRLLA